MERIYHVGLAQQGTKAVFQYRRDIDFLSCEILRYYGQRQTTKAAAIARLRETKAAVLASLQTEYPGRFSSVAVD